MWTKEKGRISAHGYVYEIGDIVCLRGGSGWQDFAVYTYLLVFEEEREEMELVRIPLNALKFLNTKKYEEAKRRIEQLRGG